MKTFTEYMDEANRTNLSSAKIDNEKSFQENYKLIEKKVKSTINRLSKKVTDNNKYLFDDKCKDVQTVLRGYEILGKRLDRGEIHKDDVAAIESKFYYLMNFCSKKSV